MKLKTRDENRVIWIDVLRGVAMFFVIWGHSIRNVSGRIRKYIYSFHMPLFFFISGLTFKEEIDISYKEFFTKKSKQLLIPYISINIVCIVVNILYNILGISKLNFFKKIAGIFVSNSKLLPMPMGITWFLSTLFLAELLFFTIKKISKNDSELFRNIFIVGIIGYLDSISKYKLNLPWHMNSSLTGVVFLSLGFAFSKYSTVFKNIFENKVKMFLNTALYLRTFLKTK